MKLTPLEIPDVLLIEPKVFPDGRGWFFESYREDIFEKHGIRDRFVQDNCSRSSKGVLRGLHYQIPPMAQAKIVRVTRGSVYDVAVDIRKSSKTFGQYVSRVLRADDPAMLYVPPGFAHGFVALEDDCEFHYKVSNFYSPANERGIIWNDPDIKIDWPKMEYIFSDKDKKYPALKASTDLM